MKDILSRVKKLDTKTLFILILSIALFFNMLLTIRNTVSYPKKEIKALRKENELIVKRNDSLILANKDIDKRLSDLDKIIDNNNKKLAKTEIELKKLKNRRNEILIYINNLSADDVARKLSKYLDKASESKNSR
jgi:regulator of replication initiation timing